MGRVSNAHGSGAWLQGPGGRGEGCCTCREEAGHQPTQCGQKPSVKLQIGNVFSTVGLPQGSRLRTAAGGLGRGSLCTYTAAQPSWRETRHRQAADPTDSRAEHELWPMIFAS